MKPLQPVRILLLLYLSITFLFPSYQGNENGREFHFFGIADSDTEYHHNGRPEIEAPHDRDHAHTILHFCPARWSQRLTSPNIRHHVSFIPSNEIIMETPKLYGTLLSFPHINPAVTHEKKASGLSPPIT